MKRFFLLLLIVSVLRPGQSQTNFPNLPANPALPGTNAAIETSDIRAKYSTFSLVSHVATYMTNVVFTNPRMKLTSAWLVAEEPPDDKYSTRHIVATTNVVMDLAGGTNGNWHVTGNLAVYDFKVDKGVTNEIVTVSGQARAESEKYDATGEPLVYDMQAKKFLGTDWVMKFKQPLHLMGETNSPEAKTNSATAAPIF